MMKFHGYAFYILLVLSLLFFHLFQTERNRKWLLLAINLLFSFLLSFYGFSHFFAFVFLILIEYAILAVLLRVRSNFFKQLVASFAVVGTLLAMAICKYSLFRDLFIDLFPTLKPIKGHVYFLGMSFLVLRWIHLIVDVTTGAIKKIEFSSYLNYVLFFPCLVAGPLDRFERFETDVRAFHRITSKEFLGFVQRIIEGGFKKTVLANTLLTFSLSDIEPTDLTLLGSGKVLLSALIYTFALYFDFSGYSDLAIGIGGLFGISVPENFDRPYLARNISDFWRRWHITFMDWLYDYIYFPVGRLVHFLGVRGVVMTSVLSILPTFLFSGVWHGDGLAFAWYGLYLALGLIVYVLWRSALRSILSSEQIRFFDESRLVGALSRVLTWGYMVFAWFFYLDRLQGLAVIFGSFGASP